MIISRTPFRISFLGGGTDYPGWYRENGGAVLSTTIDKYCYLTCRYLPPFFEHRYRVVYSKMENCNAIDEIAHPAVRGVLRHLGWERGLEIHHDADLPARSGMGSSSSFTVGLLHALHGLRGEMRSKAQLLGEALHVEQDVLRETVGSQDQAAAAHGGLNTFVFEQSGGIVARRLILSAERMEELESHLMLFYSGIKRTASDVAESFVPGIAEKRAQLGRFRAMVDEGAAILSAGRPLREFGTLLDEAWRLKRGLSALVSNADVDEMYAAALGAGAWGGKLLGAGGGGFVLIFAPPERRAAVRDALRGHIHVPFRMESSGSQIIFYDPEQEYHEAEAERASGAHRAFREMGAN